MYMGSRVRRHPLMERSVADDVVQALSPALTRNLSRHTKHFRGAYPGPRGRAVPFKSSRLGALKGWSPAQVPRASSACPPSGTRAAHGRRARRLMLCMTCPAFPFRSTWLAITVACSPSSARRRARGADNHCHVRCAHSPRDPKQRYPPLWRGSGSDVSDSVARATCASTCTRSAPHSVAAAIPSPASRAACSQALRARQPSSRASRGATASRCVIDRVLEVQSRF
eukprot:6233008-Prymnesium_polylepis.1